MGDWLRSADRQNFGRDGGSFTRAPSIICLHSTEGGSWPSYAGGAVAPHFTINPKNGNVRQHVPMDRAARALEHPAGTPQTNRAGVIQIEVIGSCDRDYARLYGLDYLPSMGDREAGHIADLLDQIAAATGIPLTEHVRWPAYPGSYGVNADQRLSRHRFASYSGVLGHMHVPDNHHGDPGNIPVHTILDHTEGDMPSAKEIWHYDGIPVKAGDKETNWTPAHVLGNIEAGGDAANRKLNQVLKAVKELAEHQGVRVDVDEGAIVDGVLAGLTPERIAAAIPDEIAQDVVDALGRRLRAT